MWAGQDDTQRFKTRVLKPPGGGSSDIFGGAPEETSPRRIKNHNHSQLGSTMFGENSSNGSDTPRAKPGNDSYKRLFGPPDAPPTPNSKNHMRSNISLSGEKSVNKSTSQSSTSTNGSSNGNIYGNGNVAYNSETGGLSCMPRNPVTGDGVDLMPVRRSARKIRDGNPVTGTGYTGDVENNSAPVQNGNGNVTEKVNGSSTGSASPPAPAAQPRGRVPPGGYSSGLCLKDKVMISKSLNCTELEIRKVSTRPALISKNQTKQTEVSTQCPAGGAVRHETVELERAQNGLGVAFLQAPGGPQISYCKAQQTSFMTENMYRFCNS